MGAGPADGRYLLRAEPTASPSAWCPGNPRRHAAPRPAGGTPAPAGGARAGADDGAEHPRDGDRPRLGVGGAPGAVHGWRSWTPSARRARRRRPSTACCSPTASPPPTPTCASSPRAGADVRAGWGEGEQVAYGEWLHARELRFSEHRGRGVARRRCVRRSISRRCWARAKGAAVRGARAARPPRSRPGPPRPRGARARARVRHRAAGAAGGGAPRPRGADRRAGAAAAGVTAAARTALGGSDPATPAESDEQALRHALARLEAALRARTRRGGAGFQAQ